MLLLHVTRGADAPVYRQLIDEITKLIEQGSLAAGDRLPPTRELAKNLGVNRTTVYRAYEELHALGYVESTPGSYTTVRRRARLAPPGGESRGEIDWARRATPQANAMHRAFLGTARDPGGDSHREGFVNLTRLDPDGRLLPVKDLQRCINHIMAERGPELLRYGKAAGYGPLREYIATRLRVHGVAASPSNVLITNGAQEGLDLAFRLLGGPGRRAALEAPTYFTVLPLLRFLGLGLEGIPMAEDGMDLDRLEEALRKRRVDFVYTIPNFQNPTGITTSQEHRERLLGICEKRRIPLVEDGFEEDMKYFGKAVLPIKSMDRRQIVIYVGTFSKVLFPGVRIGWITADEACIERLTALKRFTDLGTGTFIQAVLDRFCREGYYDIHLKRLHRIYRRRMQTALDAMERHFPAGVQWTRPAGGYTIWIKTGVRGGEERLREAMDRHRVLISLGRRFFPDDRRTDQVRVSIADVDETEISEGVARLGMLLRDLRGAKGD